ncbi:hypothetical protein QBC34DRAFT_456925 [Podospora aff. communis PSN243]|uniref:Uncharacterized protein n=1 Tax=Podospora aff. communis PSN243 TaxID=3040156 RepID=A0AAV9GVB1_9PEZI|nr:hypothetical protein QBC34DRAFT_456925 [Podospora aff. communis PSN243]
MATLREGPNIDIVARLVRKTALNEHLTLPVAAAVAFLSCESSGRYLAKIAELLSRLGADASLVSRAAAHRAGRVALGLGTAGFLLSLNDWLNKWYANNWTATKKGEWDWDREIVVVTGASSGVGASVVQKLLERNPRTTIVVVDFAPLSWTPPEGSKVHYYQADLSNTDVVRDICERIRAEVGHPTVLVNNAGIARGFTVMEGTYADVELTIKTNLLAPFLLVKEFLPDMVKNNHGHIVSICSMSSVVAPPGLVDYSATKNGILSLHEGLQVELVRRYKAPKVRLTNGIFNFIKTPLFTGNTGIPNFLAPLLHVETVSESIVDSLYSGYGRTIILPGIMRYISMLRGGPEWLHRGLRNRSDYPINFRGRQQITETGGLAPNNS